MHIKKSDFILYQHLKQEFGWARLLADRPELYRFLLKTLGSHTHTGGFKAIDNYSHKQLRREIADA